MLKEDESFTIGCVSKTFEKLSVFNHLLRDTGVP